MNKTQTGFTLIEILVATVILAIMISTASLGFGRGAQQRFSSNVEQSQQWLQHVSTEAILTGSMWGVTVADRVMTAYVWSGQEWLESADIEAFKLPENIRYNHTVVVDNDTNKPKPHFTLFPTGQIMPAEDIVISNDDEQARLSWQDSFSPQVIYSQ